MQRFHLENGYSLHSLDKSLLLDWPCAIVSDFSFRDFTFVEAIRRMSDNVDLSSGGEVLNHRQHDSMRYLQRRFLTSPDTVLRSVNPLECVQ